MTDKECLEKIDAIHADFMRDFEKARQLERKNTQKVVDEWAAQHHRFYVGDIIRSNGITIKVGYYYGEYAKSLGRLYVAYTGIVLVKGKPRKDGWSTTIYDDGRKIEKL